MSKRYPGVTKRGSSWAWRAQFSDGGRRTGLSGSGYGSAKEAWEARCQALRDAAEHPGEIPDLTLGEYLDRWLEGHVQTVRPGSAVQYRSRVNKIKETSFADAVLRDLDEFDYRHLVAELRAQAPAHRTLTLKVSTLSMALDAAVRNGLARRNPLPSIRVSRTTQSTEYTPWTVAEAQAFLTDRRKADDPLHHLWHLALHTGMRRGELHGLRWSDIEGDRLVVRRQRISIGGEVVEGPPKTTSSEAPVLLDARTLELLDEVPRVSEYVVNDPRTGRPYVAMKTFTTD